MPFTPMFERLPNVNVKQIRTVYAEALKDGQLTLHPPYQRDACWNMEQKSYLIDSIMNNIPLHNFLLYEKGKDYECVDGQNRLLTIKEFIEQTPDENLFFWNVNDERIYYKDSDEWQLWIDEEAKTPSQPKQSTQPTYRAMTEDERSTFDKFILCIQTIDSELTLQNRMDIFRRYQNGTAIAACDKFLASSHDSLHNQLIIEFNLRAEGGPVDSLCSLLKCHKSNWIWDLKRMILVFINHEYELKYSAIDQQKAPTIINDPKGDYKITREDYCRSLKTLYQFLEVFKYLEQLKENMHMSIIVSLAYIWFNAAPALKNRLETPAIMLERIRCIVQNKEIKRNTMNSRNNIKDMLISFPLIKEIIESTTPLPAKEVPHAPSKVGKALRNKVWDTYLGNIAKANCVCCNINQIDKTDFQAGHVEASANGGKNTLENLRPICRNCNDEMGTQHMRTFMLSHEEYVANLERAKL